MQQQQKALFCRSWTWRRRWRTRELFILDRGKAKADISTNRLRGVLLDRTVRLPVLHCYHTWRGHHQFRRTAVQALDFFPLLLRSTTRAVAEVKCFLFSSFNTSFATLFHWVRRMGMMLCKKNHLLTKKVTFGICVFLCAAAQCLFLNLDARNVN